MQAKKDARMRCGNILHRYRGGTSVHGATAIPPSHVSEVNLSLDVEDFCASAIADNSRQLCGRETDVLPSSDNPTQPPEAFDIEPRPITTR